MPKAPSTTTTTAIAMPALAPAERPSLVVLESALDVGLKVALELLGVADCVGGEVRLLGSRRLLKSATQLVSW